MVTDGLRRRYPFESHYLELAPGALRFHYLDEGPRSGPPLLMLHGNPTWSFYYRNLVLALRDKYRCIAPDHIGCGLSDKPQAYPYTLVQHVLNVEKLVEQLDLRELTLVLHDWGGAIGMGLARRQPARIKRLVILNTAAFASPRIPFRISICRVPLFGALAIRGFNAFARAALSMAVVRPLAPEVRAGLLAPYDSWRNRVAHLRFVQDIPMSPAHPSWPVLQEIEAALPQFADRPMLICWGLRDWCFDASFLKTWREKFPRAEVLELPSAGHYVLEDAHAEIAEKARVFLERTQQS